MFVVARLFLTSQFFMIYSIHFLSFQVLHKHRDCFLTCVPWALLSITRDEVIWNIDTRFDSAAPCFVAVPACDISHNRAFAHVMYNIMIVYLQSTFLLFQMPIGVIAYNFILDFHLSKR